MQEMSVYTHMFNDKQDFFKVISETDPMVTFLKRA